MGDLKIIRDAGASIDQKTLGMRARRVNERMVIGCGTFVKAESGFESFGWDGLGGNPVHRNADQEPRVIKERRTS
jgi:hypothetical protein